MNAFDLRLAFRLHRFEILGFGMLIGLLGSGAWLVAWNLDATGYAASCALAEAPSPFCERMGRSFYDLQSSQAQPVGSLLVILPFLAGALVGVPLVGRELERGTSRLAWSLAPSRMRWFAWRLLPAMATVFALAFLAGAGLDRLIAATEPGTDPLASFSGFGGRGIVLAARAVFVFAVGVAVGAIVGRSLPALILTAVIAYVGLAGGSNVHGRILASEAVLSATETGQPGDLFVDQRFKLPDGRLVGWQEVERLYPYPEDGTTEWPGASLPLVSFVVPRERYREVEAREVAALGGGSLVAFVLAGFTVRRRRPG